LAPASEGGGYFLKRIVTAAILIPLVLALILFGPLWLLMLTAWAVAELALQEYLPLAGLTGAGGLRRPVMVCCAFLFLVAYWFPSLLLAGYGLSATVLFTMAAATLPMDRVLRDTAAAVFGLVYIGLPMIFAALLTARENGTAQLLFALLVTWAGDIAALYVGRALGRHRMAPVLSPKKTWEGAAGSAAGAVATGLLVVWVAGHITHHGVVVLSYLQPWWYWTLLAVLLNVAAQTGDLLESAIKRGAGIKDSGSILPGHGGILDRIDAMLLAIPVLWYVLVFRQSF
jgi:phosphatidate cytidylyltransferase